ncbi:hypothetical protein BpHYR1_047983 [Brachionus plicatilis]|uniref:Secreted protein n=1 Tax=Brachionus plicatilis TaxID=10195 RepID=A0A3M7R4S0_BRAPC|nr:hypothetical protein BpHYR1_047983 [Brachionus plicatilis]
MLRKIFSLFFFSSILLSSFQMPVLKDTKNENALSWDFDDEYTNAREDNFDLTTSQTSYEYQNDIDFFNSEPERDETDLESQFSDKLEDLGHEEIDTNEPTTNPYFVGTFETEILYPSTSPYTSTVKLMKNEEYIDIDQNDDYEKLFF